MKRRVFIIAGEASGDLHGANMMRAVRSLDQNVEFEFWGGDRMVKEGGKLRKHVSELAFMGFWEVFTNLKTILSNFKKCKAQIETFNPDVLVLIDYPGFNLRMAEWAKSKGVKTFYYISPQVWAWKQKRVYKIKKVVDKMCVILPFEAAFYAKFGFEVEYVGHPLLDEIERWNKEEKIDMKAKYNLDERPIIAVLPGSRKQEISRKLPVMLEALEGLTSHQIVVAGAPNFEITFYKPFLKEGHKIVFGETYPLLAASNIAVVTSGTATLETALFDVPEVICYKGSEISYQIAKRLVNIKYISLVNLIMDKEIVKELIQKECTSMSVREEVDRILSDDRYRETMLSSYENMRQLLGGGGASQKVAQSLLKTIDCDQ